MKRCVIEAVEGGERAALAHASGIRQHTSAYVSIRQHTLLRRLRGESMRPSRMHLHSSAYVSIRQHTSGYVQGRERAALANASGGALVSMAI